MTELTLALIVYAYLSIGIIISVHKAHVISDAGDRLIVGTVIALAWPIVPPILLLQRKFSRLLPIHPQGIHHTTPLHRTRGPKENSAVQVAMSIEALIMEDLKKEDNCSSSVTEDTEGVLKETVGPTPR
ncbi:MAG: hypothetical protein D6690_17000 [Nitrospirae bacterium]|nr:MAG: hypothetical protein D6690_17000 [Nitrospirota bacterium]